MEWAELDELSAHKRQGWPYTHIPSDIVVDEENNRIKLNADGSYRKAPRKPNAPRDKGEYGADLDKLTLEALAHEVIPKELLQVEMDSLPNRWFDHRFWHPTRATMELSKHWRAATNAANLKYFGKGGQGFKGDNCFMSKTPGQTAKQFWQMRQIADRYCVPYEFFAFKIIELACTTKYLKERIPSAAVVLKREELVSDTIEAWHRQCAAKLMLPKHPAYLYENWRELPDQVAFQKWLLEELRNKNNYALCKAMFHDRMVVPKLAAQVLGTEKILSARDIFLCENK